jgi:hypothetical protein
MEYNRPIGMQNRTIGPCSTTNRIQSSYMECRIGHLEPVQWHVQRRVVPQIMPTAEKTARRPVQGVGGPRQGKPYVPPTRSMEVSPGTDATKGCATVNICLASSRVGETTMAPTFRTAKQSRTNSPSRQHSPLPCSCARKTRRNHGGEKREEGGGTYFSPGFSSGARPAS